MENLPVCLLSVFFFSSRRRHTRCGRDWSSDVCSSDLPHGRAGRRGDGPDPGRAFARAAVRPLGHTEPVLRALGRSPRGARRARAARRGARLRAPRVRARGVGAIVHPRRTVVIEAVAPTVDGGRYPVKREMGAVLEVTADIFKEGHEVLVASLKYRRGPRRTWRDSPM